MKKRTGILGVLIAVLVLGIGYATLSRDLYVSGTGSIIPNDENFDVKFDESVTPTTTTSVSGATVSGSYDDELNATIEVTGLEKKDDTATVVYTIINDSVEYGATLSIDTTDPFVEVGKEDYFDVTAVLGKTTLAAKDGSTVDSTTLTVTVTALKSPVDDTTANINVHVIADAAEKNQDLLSKKYQQGMKST